MRAADSTDGLRRRFAALRQIASASLVSGQADPDQSPDTASAARALPCAATSNVHVDPPISQVVGIASGSSLSTALRPSLLVATSLVCASTAQPLGPVVKT